MLDALRSRRGLVASAAVVILCILAFFLVTAPTWRSLVGGGPKLAGSVASGPASVVSATSGNSEPPAPATDAGSRSSASTQSGSTGGAAPGNPAAAPPAGVIAPGSSTVASNSAPSAKNTAEPTGPVPAPALNNGRAEQTALSPKASAPLATGTETSSAPGDTKPPVSAAPGTSIPSGQTGPSSVAKDEASPNGSVLASRQTSIDGSGSLNKDAGHAPAGLSPDVPGATPSGSGSDKTGQPQAANDPQPSFDIIRVEPAGDSVIAARGTPNSEIALLDGSTVIAHEKADANGQVAFLPPSLKPGDHSLTLSMTPPGGARALSSQSVVVSVPNEPKTAPMVALIQPNRPAAILSGPVADAAAPASSPPVGTGPISTPGQSGKIPASGPLAVRSVEVETMGSFYASGRAQPDSKTRVYLNGAYVASVTADPNGVWSLRISRGMKPGHYEVRADQLGPDGQVAARVEVPFDYPAQVSGPGRPGERKKKHHRRRRHRACGCARR